MRSNSGDGAHYVERAHALAASLEAAAPRIEEARELPPDVLAALYDHGFFRLALPRSMGGVELDLPTFVKVVEALGRADASVAWCVSQAGGCATAAAYLEPAAAREIFAKPDAVVAWGPPLAGAGSRALAVAGGYRLTGSWQFMSGMPHATWLGATFCQIHEPDGTPRRDADGAPLPPRVMLFPKAKATAMNVWDVIGLKGTGSDNYSLSDLFVPEAFTFVFDSPADRREAGPLYRFPTLSLYGYAFAGVALGVAQAAVDAFVTLAMEKVPFRFAAALRENTIVQSEVAMAHARLRSARLFLMHSLEESWEHAVRTGALTLEQRLSLRLATTHAIGEAKAVVTTVYEFAGSTALYAVNPFERRFRDIHAITQHIQARFSNYEVVGKALLGLSPGHFI